MHIINLVFFFKLRTFDKSETQLELTSFFLVQLYTEKYSCDLPITEYDNFH